jgi:dihydrofolate reductase
MNSFAINLSVMRKLIMKMSISIDGFVCGARGESDWIFKTGDAAAIEWQIDLFRTVDMFIMGRKSFETMAPYWPVATGPFAAPMNEKSKGVFTRNGFPGLADPTQGSIAPEHTETRRSETGLREADTLSPATTTWAEARIFNGDLATEVRRLKQEEGKSICALGGAGFMQSLIATGLIDEFHLLTHPVALGQGMQIFSALGNPLYLKLVEVRPFSSGAIAHVYHAI